jgi:hypothetical protein
MLVLMEKPGAERIFPDVEAVKASFREPLAVVRDPAAYREGYPGVGREGGGSENEVRPYEPCLLNASEDDNRPHRRQQLHDGATDASVVN